MLTTIINVETGQLYCHLWMDYYQLIWRLCDLFLFGM